MFLRAKLALFVKSAKANLFGCVNDIDNVVAQFLALSNDVHVVDSELIAVNLVVYVVDVLALQLVAIVIDFVFDVV
jgi:hypothetical protein